MTTLVPFDGDLDAPAAAPAPAPAPAAALVPFDGALDAAPEPTAGAGRGLVNPPLATEPQPVPAHQRDVGMGEGAFRDMRVSQAGFSKVAGLALSMVPLAAERVLSAVGEDLFGKDQTTDVADASFRTLVDPAAAEKEHYEFKPGENRSIMNRVLGALTAMTTTDLPAMMASGGEAAAPMVAREAQPVAQFLREAVEHGLKASRPVMFKAAEEKADQVLKAGGTEQQATISALTAAMTSAVQNSAAMSIPGGLAKRVASGGIVNVAMGQSGRALQNAADPESMRVPLGDPGDIAVDFATGGMLAGAMGERAPARPRDRIDLGYDPLTSKTATAEAVQGMGDGGDYRGPEPGVAQPAERMPDVTSIFKAGSVEEAAAAAARVVRGGNEDAGIDAELDSLRPLRPPEDAPPGVADERGTADVSGLPRGTGEPGAADAAGGVDPAVGDRGAAVPPVDGAGDGGAPEGGTAPVGAERPATLTTRPYTEPERAQAQAAVDVLNDGLQRSNADRKQAGVEGEDAPVMVLTAAPSEDMLRARLVGRLVGVPVVFVDPHEGFNGVAINGTAYISPSEKHPVLAVAGHEVLHGVLQNMPAERRADWMNILSPFLKAEAVAKKLELEPHRGEEHAREEVIADLNGSMWLDPKFWAAVREKDPHTFRQLVYRFMEMATKVGERLAKTSRFQAERFTEDVATVRGILADMTARAARGEGVEKPSPNEKVELGLRKPGGEAKFSRDKEKKPGFGGAYLDDAIRRARNEYTTAFGMDHGEALSRDYDFLPIKKLTSTEKVDQKKVDKLKAAMDDESPMDSRIPPVVVDSDGNVLDGHHRIEAAKQLGYGLVPAFEKYSRDAGPRLVGDEPKFDRRRERPEPRADLDPLETMMAPRLDTALRRWAKGEGDDRALAAAIRADLDSRRERREAAADRDRARGPKWVQQRLLEAERHGQIPEETGEAARWLLQHSPHLATDLALSVRERGGSARGMYNPAERLVTLFRNADVRTGVHEILHHTERMMPADVQDGIRAAWAKAVKQQVQEVRERVLRRPTDLGPEAKRNQGYLQALDVMQKAAEAGHGDMARLLYTGGRNSPLPPLRHVLPYELSSPSEFWAVRGSELLGDRYDAEMAGRHLSAPRAWVEKARQWVRDLVQFAREKLGLKSNAAVLRGLSEVIGGDGQRRPGTSMLENSRRPLADEPSFSRREVEESPEFKRWFAGSKAVDEKGRPLVLYHGSPVRDITVFDPARTGQNTGNSGWFGRGIYLTENKHFASGFTKHVSGRSKGEGQVYKAYLSLKNPYVADLGGKENLDKLRKMDLTPEEREQLSAWWKGARASGEDTILDMTTGKGGLGGDWLSRVLERNGYDGVYAPEGPSTGEPEYVAFRPEQIKSADGSNTTFDPKNPDIRFDRDKREPFYSALSRGVESIPAKAQGSDGWRAQIKGLVNKGLIKQDEVEWTGVNDWLALQQGKVTKEAVLDYLKANGVKVEEVVLGDKAATSEADSIRVSLDAQGFTIDDTDGDGMPSLVDRDNQGGERHYTMDGGELHDENWSPLRDDDPMKGNPRLMDAERAFARYMEIASNASPDGALPRYNTKDFTLPGGENYREVLLKLSTPTGALSQKTIDDLNRQMVKKLGEPMTKDQLDTLRNVRNEAFDMLDDWEERLGLDVAQARAEAAGGESSAHAFRSRHWDEPNVLAHIRLNDRTDADGKKVLFVEEVQSDWAQEGRKQGFVSEGKLPDGWTVHKDEKTDRWYVIDRSNTQVGLYGETREAAIASATTRDGFTGGVPRGPFVEKTDAWVNLALKRIIKLATDEGYDRVAFVNGKQSADRYSLDRHVDKISYEPSEKGFYINGVMAGGRNIKHGDFTRAEVEELVGRDVLQRMEAGEGEPESHPDAPDYEDLKNIRVLSGDGLKMGGEGMKAFYDQIIPSALNKMLPKLGGEKVGDVRIGKVEPKADIDRKAMREDLRELAKGNLGYDEFRENHGLDGHMVTDAELEDISDRDPYNRHRVGPLITGLIDAIAQRVAGGRAMKQPGFDVTPAMREKAAPGLPLFSRKGEEERQARVSPEDARAMGEVRRQIKMLEKLKECLG